MGATPSVVIQIAGGLGNQLFEYAFGRAMSLRHGVPLVLDHLSSFPRDAYQRVFTLDKYNIHCDRIHPRQSYATFTGRVRRRLDRYVNRGRPLAGRSYVQEIDPFKFDPAVRELPIRRRTYFEGYWQHEEYFSEYRDVLLKDLTITAPRASDNLEMARRIESVEAVALHVRRFHVAPGTDASAAVSVGENYYDRAIGHLAGRVANPHLFVFADDPAWAKENLRLPFPVEYVTHNGPERDYEDLWLMSLCRHFIIANSTFSWWGAWLARHDGKVIIAPRDGIGPGLKSIPRRWTMV